MCNLADKLIEEGIEEGLNVERSRTINKMREKGMSIEQIAELLELPFEEVENFVKSLVVD